MNALNPSHAIPLPSIPTIAHEMGLTPPSGPLPSTQETVETMGTRNLANLLKGLQDNDEKTVEETLQRITARVLANMGGGSVAPDDIDIDVDFDTDDRSFLTKIGDGLSTVVGVITTPFHLASFKVKEWWESHKIENDLTYKVLSWIGGLLAFFGTVAVVFTVCVVMFQWITLWLASNGWIILA